MGQILASLGSALGSAGASAGAGAMAGGMGGGGMNFGQIAHGMLQNTLKYQNGGAANEGRMTMQPQQPNPGNIQQYLDSLFSQIGNHVETAPYVRKV